MLRKGNMMALKASFIVFGIFLFEPRMLELLVGTILWYSNLGLVLSVNALFGHKYFSKLPKLETMQGLLDVMPQSIL